MQDKAFTFLNTSAPVREFIDFRAKCGWGMLSFETAKKTLRAGVVNTTVYDDDKVAGFGRIIGDGAIYFYVQDLIVDTPYQGAGLGTSIMKHLITQTREIASPGASIGLMSAKGKEAFYEGLGFSTRPNQTFGAGMTLLLEPS